MRKFTGRKTARLYIAAVALLSVCAPLSAVDTNWNFNIDTGCADLGCGTTGNAALYEKTKKLCIGGTYTRTAAGFIRFTASTITEGALADPGTGTTCSTGNACGGCSYSVPGH